MMRCHVMVAEKGQPKLERACYEPLNEKGECKEHGKQAVPVKDLVEFLLPLWNPPVERCPHNYANKGNCGICRGAI